MSEIMDKLLIFSLKKIYLFQDLKEDELLDFSKNIELKMYFEWQNLILEWDVIKNIFILKDWKLVVKKANAFDSKILGYINSWEIFGEMSYINQTKPMASVVAKQDSDVWVIPINIFETLLTQNLELREKILVLINKRQEDNIESLKFGGRGNSLDDLRFDFIE